VVIAQGIYQSKLEWTPETTVSQFAFDLAQNEIRLVPSVAIWKPYLQFQYSSGTTGPVHGTELSQGTSATKLDLGPWDRILNPSVMVDD
jgi:hypothetical protein